MRKHIFTLFAIIFECVEICKREMFARVCAAGFVGRFQIFEHDDFLSYEFVSVKKGALSRTLFTSLSFSHLS
jgi:hypothetical protein